MSKYQLDFTTAFSKDLKRIKKRGYNLSLMNEVVKLLQNGELLPEKYKDHALTGNWKGFRDCHIQPDWILVYRVYHNKLLLVLSRTGTHSDLDLSQEKVLRKFTSIITFSQKQSFLFCKDNCRKLSINVGSFLFYILIYLCFRSIIQLEKIQLRCKRS